jgi:WhiB family redox-sensing transcriptional regulator
MTTIAGLIIHLDEQRWMLDALCAETDPEIFFPDKGGSVRDAKKICRRCDVRAECLDYALTHRERYGVWGGLSENERRGLLRKASPKSIDHQAFRSRAL